MDQIRTAALGASSAATSVASILISLDLVEQWARILTGLAGLAAVIFSIYWMDRLNRAKLAREQCAACAAGQPALCPFPPKQRPPSCPHR